MDLMQAVGKSRNSADEMQAVYLFDQASAEVKKKLKLIWGTDAPQHTPVTLPRSDGMEQAGYQRRA